ncbi:MAG: hypothetical protein QNJ17_11090 [Desulfocapsaceae bacterium]|nr:hypothetical protein [Desulfocapsaceae bacterium]
MNSLKIIPEHIELVACSYCNGTFKKLSDIGEPAKVGKPPGSQPISHGTCPDCLLKNFPQEYLMIQKDGRVRIKRFFQKKYMRIECR